MNSLIIKNFGPIRDLQVEIRPITLFIGPQGCGKSTVSKVFTIVQDAQWALDILQKKDSVFEAFDKFSISEFFQKETYIRYKGDDYPYDVIYEQGTFHVKAPSKVSSRKLEKILLEAIAKSNKGLLARIGISEKELPQLQNMYSELLRANARFVLYVPAERNLIGNLSQYIMNFILADIPLNGSLKEYISIYERAKAKISTYDAPFLNVRYMQENNEERLYVSENQHISFQAGSSGVQSVLPMLMVINYSRTVKCFDCFVIEEPEQNLFPKNQLDLLQLLLSYKARYIFTTHSPYLLSALNVLLLAGKLTKQGNIPKEEISKVVSEDVFLDSENVAVYSINQSSDKANVTNLIDSKTGLVNVNSLDGVSEVIAEQFNQLMSIAMKYSKGNKK